MEKTFNKNHKKVIIIVYLVTYASATRIHTTCLFKWKLKWNLWNCHPYAICFLWHLLRNILLYYRWFSYKVIRLFVIYSICPTMTTDRKDHRIYNCVPCWVVKNKCAYWLHILLRWRIICVSYSLLGSMKVNLWINTIYFIYDNLLLDPYGFDSRFTLKLIWKL